MCLKKVLKKKKNNTLTTIYTDSVKKHEVVLVVVVSRWWETLGGQGGGMYVPRVNGMITSNRSTRDVSVGEERKKWGWTGRGRIEGCPRKNRKFRRVRVREKKRLCDRVKKKREGEDWKRGWVESWLLARASIERKERGRQRGEVRKKG